MSKVTKPQDETTMHIPESKWNEEQRLKDVMTKKIRTLQEALVEKDNRIHDLEKAVEITQFSKASDLTEGDKVELKMARAAYKSFSFIYEDDMWHFEFYCDPMLKKCELLSFKRLK